MRFLRHTALRWGIGLFLVVGIVLAIILLNAPSILRREIERRSDGVVRVDDLELSATSVTLLGVTIDREGIQVRCAAATTPLALSSQPLPLARVALEGCNVEIGAGSSTATTRTEDSTEQGVRSPIAPALRRLDQFADVVQIDDLVARAEGHGEVRLQSIRVSHDSGGHDIVLNGLQAQVAAETFGVEALTLAIAADGGVSAGSGGLVQWGPWRAGCDGLEITPDLSSARCGTFQLGHSAGLLSLRFESVDVVRAPQLALDARGGELDLVPGLANVGDADRRTLARRAARSLAGAFGIPLPEASTTEQPSAADEGSGDSPANEDPTSPGVMACIEGADCWAPSPIAAFLSRAMDRVEQWPSLRAQILAFERPDIRVEVRDLALEVGGVGLGHVETLSFSDEEFRLHAGTGDVSFTVGADLTELARIDVSASGLDLAATGPWLHPDLVTRGSLGFVGEFEADGPHISASMSVELEGAGFTWPAVSPLPVDLEAVGIGLEWRAGGGACGEDCDATPEQRALVAEAVIDYGGVEVASHLHLLETEVGDWSLNWRGELAEAQSCGRLWRLIPEGMLPTLGRRGLRFEGDLEWALGATYRFGDPWSFEPTSELFPGTCRISWVTPEFDPEQLNSDFYVHHVTEGVERQDIVVGPGTDSYVRLHTLPVYVPAAMYLSEEINFYNGVGVSLNLIRRAVALNIARGRYAYGGSTIMQQLVKNLFLSRSKTLSRKLEEALLVWAMLERVEKDRILELYVNCIEFAPDVYGIAAASEHYFGRPPQWLTPLEAIYLANLKPSPASAVNHYRRGHSPIRGWWQDRTRVMLQRLVQHTGSVHPDEVDFYAPYIVALTGSPAWRESGYEPIERPEWAVLGGQAPLPDAMEAPTTPKE